jgi:hypothetical protein
MPSQVRAEAQNDCRAIASNSNSPLSGLLMNITWPQLRSQPTREWARGRCPPHRVMVGRVPLLGRSRSRRVGAGAWGSRKL